MNKLTWLLAIILLASACKSKKDASANDENAPLTYPAFRELFPKGQAPFTLAVDSVAVNLPDSLAFKTKVVTQFHLDSLLNDKGNKQKAHYFPMKYFKESAIDYFLVKKEAAATREVYLCLYDKEGAFINKILVGKSSANQNVNFSLDRRYNIKISTRETAKDGSDNIKEEFFDVSSQGEFILVLTNSNTPVASGQYFNPIDTLPQKHKLSGDYVLGENNIVSIRDGDTPHDFLFFIHLDKEKGACIAEMDGAGRFTTATNGHYKDKSSACSVEFKFSGNKVSLEENGCGAYRGIKCSFSGTYTKKKVQVKKTK